MGSTVVFELKADPSEEVEVVEGEGHGEDRGPHGDEDDGVGHAPTDDGEFGTAAVGPEGAGIHRHRDPLGISVQAGTYTGVTTSTGTGVIK